jgi:Transcriptional regulator PadR-like family
MVPDTRYAILGLLLRGPSHGYELAKRFAELLGPGLAINRGQVYDMLANLERKGWVERLGSPETLGGSQSYQITTKGERAFPVDSDGYIRVLGCVGFRRSGSSCAWGRRGGVGWWGVRRLGRGVRGCGRPRLGGRLGR